MSQNAIKRVLIKSFGAVIPAALPPLHIFVLYHFWGRYSRHVDKKYCSCSCWDTVFKGTYESGVASYKHVYFNATFNATKMWLTTVLATILLYESCKYEMRLLCESRARFLMLILFVMSLFSHYYTWWVYFNYWNDDFYSQWNHQMFFTLTELISTLMVLHLSDSRVALTSRKVMVVTSIATVHILIGSWDQFVSNVVWGEGQTHQVFRDMGFMMSDFMHVLLPFIELLRSRKHTETSRYDSSLIKDTLFMVVIVTAGFSVSYFL